MSTTASLSDAQFAEALARIDELSRDVPIETTLTELQLVIERVSFSGLHERETQNDAATFAEIELFFRDEVSPGMVDFVRWAAEASLLSAFAGDEGTIFLDRCASSYRDVQEVQFVTAIPLEKAHKSSILRRLRGVYPEPARILFNTSTLIGAGFVIRSGNSVIDKSLRTYVANAIPRTANVDALVGESEVDNG